MIVGHKKQIKELNNFLQSKKIPQAYLFVGPAGIGKFHIAKIFASALIKEEKSLDVDKEYVFDRMIFSDLDILKTEITENKGIVKDKKVDVKKIREAQKRLALFPSVGKFRVLLIDDVEKLNIYSQNTLLKTLEEPNKSSIIILVASESSGILDTILSRCQKIQFNLVGFEEMKKFFKNNIKTNNLDKIIIYSMGRPGNVIKYINGSDDIKKRECEVRELKEIFSLMNFEKIKLAEEYSKKIPDVLNKLEFWIWFLRVQAYKNMNKEEDFKKYYDLIEKIDRALQKIKSMQNLNKKLILENLFLNLW